MPRLQAGECDRLVFEYPDGPFFNTFTFDPVTRDWTSLMRNNSLSSLTVAQKNASST